jgi:hypothetical protein
MAEMFRACRAHLSTPVHSYCPPAHVKTSGAAAAREARNCRWAQDRMMGACRCGDTVPGVYWRERAADARASWSEGESICKRRLR